jgi:isochorismate hydrolase
MEKMRNGLLIIDMQNYFFNSQEKRVKYLKLTASVNSLIEVFDRSHHGEIFYIISQHKADKSTWSRNMLKNNSGCLLEESDEAMIVKDIKLSKNRTVIPKTRHSAFMRTELEQILAKKKVQRLFLCGVYTHGCIALTAIDGWGLDFEVLIAKECIFSHRRDLSDFIIERLKNMLKIPFLSNQEIQDLLLRK